MASHPSDPLQTAIPVALQLLKNGQGAAAVTIVEPLMQQFPGHPQLHHILGLALEQTGNLAQAIHHISRAIVIEPRQVEMYRSLANLLRKAGKTTIALERLKDALQLAEDLPDLHFLMGDMSMDLGMMASAMAGFVKAIDLDPTLLSAWINLGLCHKAVGELRRAEKCFEQALSLDPRSAEAHVNLAHTLLLLGDESRGFDELEWRFHLPGGSGLAVHPPDQLRRWSGEPLHHKKIVVLAEQGYGDTIQFIRFVPRLLELGGQVTVIVAKPLEPLLQGQPGLGKIQAEIRWSENVDYFIPMMSLARHFITPRHPPVPPYIFADPERSRHWRQRLPPDRFKIGLVWEGKPLHQNDPLRRRSVNLDSLAPLWQRDERRLFISLQKKETTADKAISWPPHANILDVGPELHDFADTAAVMDNLDLIISIDTATAHLAGALGKPVWILLPLAPDWRWTADQDVTPWYPSSRLYRQSRPNRWEEPVAQILADLEKRP
ncbi:MAG: tetratricopeptide repeat protein [Magnetococcales bacterium]|nr:tetratricopeptide repeat protein [Magnetococcales bacterium]